MVSAHVRVYVHVMCVREKEREGGRERERERERGKERERERERKRERERERVGEDGRRERSMKVHGYRQSSMIVVVTTIFVCRSATAGSSICVHTLPAQHNTLACMTVPVLPITK